ncbi:unnamed protein product [Callosobruchus maculatus]|nr:unnamed protein product [Callosobruchus maculatus]
MWFEIIPAFAIICAALAAPHGAAYITNYLALGNMYRRCLETHDLQLQYIRDRRLADGNPYKVMGLENIPDEEEHQCQCGCQKKQEEEDEEVCEAEE